MAHSEYQSTLESSARMRAWSAALSAIAKEDPVVALDMVLQLVDEAERNPFGTPHVPAVLHSMAPLAMEEGLDKSRLWNAVLRLDNVHRMDPRRHRVYKVAMFFTKIPFAAMALDPRAFEDWWGKQLLEVREHHGFAPVRAHFQQAIDGFSIRFGPAMRARLIEGLDMA